MTEPVQPTAVDFSAGPRVLVGTAADLIFRVGRSVLGEDRMSTARDNAWAAVCADRERARVRAEVQRAITRHYP
jgi:hypothetical protein